MKALPQMCVCVYTARRVIHVNSQEAVDACSVMIVKNPPLMWWEVPVLACKHNSPIKVRRCRDRLRTEETSSQEERFRVRKEY